MKRSILAVLYSALSQKRLAGLLVLATVLPFVVLCFYSHPAADDFTDAVQRREAGFWLIQHDLYLHLTGRLFTSVILTEASPLVLGLLDWYWLVPLFALLLLFSSLFTVLTVVVGSGWGAGTRALAAGLLLALWLLQNPSVAESVYWFNGVVVYTVPSAVLVFWLAALVRFWQAAPRQPRAKWLAACLGLGTCVLWSNEIIALPLFAVAGGLCAWEWQRRGPRRTGLLVLAGWYGVALAVSLLAPGNMARAALINVAVPWHRIVLGPVAGAAYMLLNWTSSGVLVTCTALVLPALARLGRPAPAPALRRLATLAPTRVLAAAGGLLLLLPLAALPSYWATGGLMPPRARASLYLLFLLGWFAAVLAGLAQARHKSWLAWLRQTGPRAAWPRPVAGLLWAWLLLNLATDHNLRLAHRDLGRASNNAVLAYRDWLSGSAARYDATLRARYHRLRTTPDLLRVRVAALPTRARPQSLLYYDVSTDSAFSMNVDYARYFRKKTVWTGPGGAGRPPKLFQPAPENE